MVKSPLAGLFGRSPFAPMQEHMAAVADCAGCTLPLFEALIAGDQAKVESVKTEIFDLERHADDLKNRLRLQLPRTLLMPVDRRDLLEMLHSQDSIADTAQDIAGILLLKQLAVPDTFQPLVIDYVRRSIDAVRQSEAIVGELDELLELGFGGREADRVESMIDELGAIETETDDQGLELTRRLLAAEDQLGKADFLLWFELVRHIGDLADHAEDVGDRLRLLIAR